MIQIAEERMKGISDKQIQAIKQIIQSRDFNLAEYRKLKKILDSRVITKRDAGAFLEYCYAKVHFERYFNGYHHKAYASCCFCKGRDNLGKIENLKTGERNWCCQTCRTNITNPDIIDLPAARGRADEDQKMNKITKIRGLATDIVLIADDSSAGIVPHEVAAMGEEIMEIASGLLRARAQAEGAETSAAAGVRLQDGQVCRAEVVKYGC